MLPSAVPVMGIIGGGIYKSPLVREPQNKCCLAATVSHAVLRTSNYRVYLLLQPFNRFIGTQSVHRRFKSGNDESSLVD
jgi:hypothetical protein